MEKLKKTAKGLDTFFGIMFWAMVIIAALLVMATVVLCVKGEGEMPGDLAGMQLSINGVDFMLAEEISESAFKSIWITTMVHFLVIFGFLFCGIRIIRRMLSPMKDGKPFSTTVSGDFRKLGWFTVLFGIVYNILMFSITAYLERILYAAVPNTINIQRTVDLNFVVIAFFFFLFAYVFRYGEELQKLSDETL